MPARILPDRPLTQRERYLRYKAAHPERVNAQKRDWEKRNPDKVAAQKKRSSAATYDRITRNKRLYERYGVTPEQYAAMWDAQGGLCLICEREETARGRGGTPWLLCVDHDHATGAVRGLLCRACNAGLGWFEDDEDLILRAAAYLSRHRREVRGDAS